MLRFVCYRCIHCCFFSEEREGPVVLWHEVLYFTELGRLMNVRLHFKSLGQGFYRLVVDGFCPFYSLGKRACEVQSEKPLACRLYPLLINVETLELTVSLMCPWVRENFNKISEGLSVEDIENTFREEFKALREIVKWVYEVSRTTPKSAVYFTTYYKDIASDIIRRLMDRYSVIKVTESSVVGGFYHILIEGEVEQDYLESLLKRDEITWYKVERVPPIS